MTIRRRPAEFNVDPLLQLYDAVANKRVTQKGRQWFRNQMWRHADQLMEVLREAEKLGHLKWESIPQDASAAFAIGKIMGSVEKLRQDIKADKGHLCDGPT
jgi:hypothetical protein